MQPSRIIAEDVADIRCTGPFPETDRSVACPEEKVAVSETSQVSAAFLPERQPLAGLSKHPLLLQVSEDENLAESRKGLLKVAGFDVHTCGSQQLTCMESAPLAEIAVALFCQSVPSERAVLLARRLLVENGHMTVVRFSKRPWLEHNRDAYTLMLQAPLAPVAFVSTMMRLRAEN